jgi:NAD(P)-dependent dehydrogenase (short-subunit alcohol dehydrogenase family)
MSGFIYANKVMLVTGGIGSALCRRFASDGALVEEA